MTSWPIRPARPEDAEAIAAMANRLNVASGVPGDVYEADTVLRGAFGPAPAFAAFVADGGGGLVGYATVQDFYETDRAARGLLLLDLYVEEAMRNAGVGRALMAAVAREALRRGGVTMTWAVLDANAGARAFYARLRARDPEARVLELAGDDLEALAREA